MRKIYTITALFSLGAFLSTSQDLQVSNIQYNYDFQTAVLDVSFDMDNTGSFSTFDGVVCEVSIMDLGTTEYVVGSTTSDSFGLSGGDTESLSVTNMDLDNVSGLATGDYYVKVCVDVTNIEVEDNEGNNCGQNNSSFQFESLGNPASIGTLEMSSLNVLVYPNPVASNTLTFALNETMTENASITITDAMGKTVLTQEILSNTEEIEIEISDLNEGMYYYRLSTAGTSTRGLFVRK